MIISVSPNISLDRVHIVRGFVPGYQSQALVRFCQPGGSGVHASEVIKILGGDTIALGFLGGFTGKRWKTEADARGLSYDMIPIVEETRESFCLVDLDRGVMVESVESGPTLSASLKDELLSHLEAHLPGADLLIVSGSVPPGLPDSICRDIIELANYHRVKTIADIFFAPLREALSARPWLIKPNLLEFHDLFQRDATTLRDRMHIAQFFTKETGIAMALSMEEEGMLLTTQETQYHLIPPQTSATLPDGKGINTIGCGDALVGGLAYEYARSKDLLGAAKLGLAAAHSNLSTYGVPSIETNEVMRLLPQIAVERSATTI